MKEWLLRFEKLSFFCLALFFVRTIFIGYKYLFFLALIPTIIYFFMSIKCIKYEYLHDKVLLFPLLIIMLFLIHFSPFSNVVKETVNLMMVLCFLLFFTPKLINESSVFFKNIAILTEIVGILAIIRYACASVSLNIPFAKYLFENTGFPLVRDNNFFALFFIISIVIFIYLYGCKKISVGHFLLFVIVSFFNILFSTSRRGYVLFGVLLLCATIMLFTESKYKKAIKQYLLIIGGVFSLMLISFFCFKDVVINHVLSDHKKIYIVYKFSTIINSSLTQSDVSSFLWGIVKREKSTNLYSNGDFSDDLKYWATSASVLTDLKIYKTDVDTFLRLERVSGGGNYSLYYTGCPIYFHKGLTYTLTFKYRVIKGNECPFAVGWWFSENNVVQRALKKEITQVDTMWKQCKVTHTFLDNQNNPTGFLNLQDIGSIIDIKDIKLTHNGAEDFPNFVYEIQEQNRNCGNNKVNNLTDSRILRWRYAIEVYQTRYLFLQKIWGQGFNYLSWYGEKFYNNSKRYDFPHNPILSALLYSGIVGMVVYITFLFMSLALYWNLRKQIGVFGVLYVCCMFFSFFSGNSHFSFPLFVFLSFLPFFIKCYNKFSFHNNSV